MRCFLNCSLLLNSGKNRFGKGEKGSVVATGSFWDVSNIETQSGIKFGILIHYFPAVSCTNNRSNEFFHPSAWKFTQSIHFNSCFHPYLLSRSLQMDGIAHSILISLDIRPLFKVIDQFMTCPLQFAFFTSICHSGSSLFHPLAGFNSHSILASLFQSQAKSCRTITTHPRSPEAPLILIEWKLSWKPRSERWECHKPPVHRYKKFWRSNFFT
jgi:hypothetical protein